MHDTLSKKKEELQSVYEAFETEAADYKQGAICKAGCAFCCTDAGNVDIITLEGLVIREHVNGFPKRLKTRITKKLIQNRRHREEGKIVRCPFLKQDDTCMIYTVRPFSCRKLYSVAECAGCGPTVHRQTVEMGREAILKMQRLDDTGYSGHIGFILSLLEKPGFRKTYLSGGFDPSKIADFAKARGIAINRFVAFKP